jgi:hypothetical protein
MSFFLHLPRKMEPIEGSQTSVFKPQTPGNYPKENILQTKCYRMWDILLPMGFELFAELSKTWTQLYVITRTGLFVV